MTPSCFRWSNSSIIHIHWIGNITIRWFSYLLITYPKFNAVGSSPERCIHFKWTLYISGPICISRTFICWGIGIGDISFVSIPWRHPLGDIHWGTSLLVISIFGDIHLVTYICDIWRYPFGDVQYHNIPTY